jgi:formylglycine-generating enzyme required for sulfatase activity
VSEVAELPSATPTSEPRVVIVTATPSGMTVVEPTATVAPTEDLTATADAAAAAEATEPVEAAGGEGDTQAVEGTPLATPTTEGDVSAASTTALNALGTDLGLVSGGDFTMGTNQTEAAAAVSVCINEYGGTCDIALAQDSFPPHRVILDSFMMEVTEVTVAQYVEFLNVLGPNSHLSGCQGSPCAATAAESEASNIEFDGTTYSVANLFANLPMANVTWYGAQAYCEAIGRRLPTEAEWERAARGTDGRIYPYGNEWDPLLANTNRNERSTERTSNGPVQVRSFPDGASPYGMYDMAGNVAEWVQDWYQADYYSTEAASGLNPQGPLTGTAKVTRGGSWDTVPFFTRTVHRQEFDPLTQALYIGFRCASDEVAGQNANAADTSGAGGQLAPSATPPANLPTVDPDITATALPSLPPGG